MVTTEQWKIPSGAQAKLRRHMISFIVICASLPLFVVNGLSVYVWFAMCALFLPIYGLFVFKMIPRVTGNKIFRMIVNGVFTLMGISIVIAMSGWEMNINVTFALRYIILPLFLLFTVGTSVEMQFLNSQQEKLQQENFDRERVLAECRFLKAQINPHFLFNTLNNVLCMISRKSDKAGEAILLLASLMRRTVHMTTVPKVSLQEEIQYIEKYIELQKLQRVQDDLTIEFRTPNAFDGNFIEPLILIAFVENAFKHGVVTGVHSYVSIDIEAYANHHLVMQVSNTKLGSLNNIHLSLDNQERSGIGLVNARRRLEIGYPQKHKLNISDGYGQYVVRLEVDL